MTTKDKGGRPAFLKKGKRVNVYLDAPSLQKAKKLGNGNISEGIRAALGPAEKPKRQT